MDGRGKFMNSGTTTLLILGVLLFLMTDCKQVKQEEERVMSKDPHSYSEPAEAVVRHLSWKAAVDFEARTITANATWQISNVGNTNVITFDIKDLQINKVILDNDTPAEFRISDKDELLGQALTVVIKPSTTTVAITYSTGPSAEALQWLTPQQTAGKVKPFLFTQSQAILARTWVPCQDSPSVRFTYDAEVTVPADLLALMSASNPQEKNDTGVYRFEMRQAIPSYLLALTVGDLSFQSISARTGVYAEPALLEKAATEFSDLERMVAGAESLYGKYQWERYDVIVLPPSFPFGGMENPRLTFATPTILAGDRSLTSLIAHELAHSWSGNLVTNATWNDFWLNEGFTVYFEHRIMEKLYGKDYSEMLAQLALQDLKETIVDLKNNNQYHDTKLQLDLTGRNPDDGVTDIAYNKGYFFLRSIEERHGRENFDAFLKDYFSENAFTSMDTDGLIAYIKSYYAKKFQIQLNESEFEKWIYTEGLPDNCPTPSSARFEKVDSVLRTWQTSKTLDQNKTAHWSTHEWLHFLKNLPENLSQEEMAQLDEFGNFTTSGNAEILTAWLTHTIRNEYEKAYPKLEEFLINTGRRKFLSPLYSQLAETEKGKLRARAIYEKARPNYHFVASNTIDKLLVK